ncbi:MAG: class I SAM-dependent methyltransferase [Anaerolineales bacterium]|jgi:O-methyltransferase involved in polyketide biosynthesis
MPSEKVHLTKEQETLLGTLYCRVLDSRSKNPILNDKSAEEIVRHLDYDFQKLKIQRDDILNTVIRAKQLDLWTNDYLANHSEATVLHLGCGLDSRVDRVARSKNVHWYDLDYPEVIELRRHFYPPRDGYFMIGTSVTDLTFLNKVQGSGPVLIIAEGLLMYLSEHVVEELLRRLTTHFQSGQLAFDVWSRLAARISLFNPPFGVTGVKGGWGIDDLRTIEEWVPQLQLVREIAWTEAIERESDKISLGFRIVFGMVNRVPSLRRMARFLLYRF